jgi:hypothetical protein
MGKVTVLSIKSKGAKRNDGRALYVVAYIGPYLNTLKPGEYATHASDHMDAYMHSKGRAESEGHTLAEASDG